MVGKKVASVLHGALGIGWGSLLPVWHCPHGSSPWGGYEFSNPTQRLGRRRPGGPAPCRTGSPPVVSLLKNFMVWGPGSGLLSCLTPEVIPKQRPTALLPLTSSRPSGEG